MPFMMKKIFISVIAVLYFTVTNGMVMNVHYCMGKISSVTFNHDADHEDGTCSKCGINKTENHCCKDEVTTVKLTDSHQTSSIAFQLSSLSSIVTFQSIDLQTPEQGLSAIPSSEYDPPPANTLNKVYLAVNVFRI